MIKQFFSLLCMSVSLMVISEASRADLSPTERTHLQAYFGDNCPGLNEGRHESSIKYNLGRLMGALGDYDLSKAKTALEIFTHLTKKYASSELTKVRQEDLAFKIFMYTVSHFKRSLSGGKIMHYLKLKRILNQYRSLSEFYALTHHLIFSNCISQTHEDEMCLMTVKQYNALNTLMSVLQLLGEDLPTQCDTEAKPEGAASPVGH